MSEEEDAPISGAARISGAAKKSFKQTILLSLLLVVFGLRGALMAFQSEWSNGIFVLLICSFAVIVTGLILFVLALVRRGR